MRFILQIFEEHNKSSWFVTLLIAGAIFYFSTMSSPAGAAGFGFSSYLYHFLAFFWLAFFLLLAFVKGRKTEFLFPAAIVAIVYAVSDEFHQRFVPYRACSFSDFLIDAAGILSASFLYLLTIRIRKGN